MGMSSIVGATGLAQEDKKTELKIWKIDGAESKRNFKCNRIKISEQLRIFIILL